jgi:hypothetical protein
MDELKQRLAPLDLIEVPDVWDEASTRTPRYGSPGPGHHRSMTIALAAVIALAGLGFAFVALRPHGVPAISGSASGYEVGPGTVPKPIAAFAGPYLDAQLCADGTGSLDHVLLEGSTTAAMLPALDTGLQEPEQVIKGYASDAPFYAVLVGGSCASQENAENTYTEGYVLFAPSGQPISFRGWYENAPVGVTDPFGGLLIANG